MRLKIISDGTSNGTRVMTDTGEAIAGQRCGECGTTCWTSRKDTRCPDCGSIYVTARVPGDNP